MFWGPSVWAGLRAGDAGNAEEELGVQQNTSAVYPRVGLPSLFELKDTLRSWISGGGGTMLTPTTNPPKQKNKN